MTSLGYYFQFSLDLSLKKHHLLLVTNSEYNQNSMPVHDTHTTDKQHIPTHFNNPKPKTWTYKKQIRIAVKHKTPNSTNHAIQIPINLLIEPNIQKPTFTHAHAHYRHPKSSAMIRGNYPLSYITHYYLLCLQFILLTITCATTHSSC